MIELLLLILLLCLSGVFSGSETALVVLSVARAEGLAKEGRHGARSLYRLKTQPARMLTALLIGNNLVNIAASVLATVVATRWFGSAGPGIAVGVLTILILVFGEITPKSLATHYSERISLFIAPFVLGFTQLIFPLVWLFERFTTWIHQRTGRPGDPTVTESELINMLRHGEQEGTIEPHERQMIERVFGFNDLKVRDVMTPHNRVFALEGSRLLKDALPEIMQASYSRIPIYDTHRDRLYKLIYLRDVLEAVVAGRENARLDEIGHEPVYISEYQAIDELFQVFRRNKRMFAVVVDEHGGMRGIVTLEDVLEELVGELYDESDAAPPAATGVSENELVVDGAAELRVIEDYFGLDLPGKPTDTVSFWILNHSESIPRVNDRFAIDGLEVEIRQATLRRIGRVCIRCPTLRDEADGEG